MKGALPFSTLERHWCHVQPPKLLANRLSPSALSPCISGVKGRCAAQLTSHSPNSQVQVRDAMEDLCPVFVRPGEAENLFSLIKADRSPRRAPRSPAANCSPL